MKTKTFFLTNLMFVFLLTYSAGIHAQTTASNLDQVKLMKQILGTWQGDVGKDTVEVREHQQYGKSFTSNVSLVIKGTKSPFYMASYCFDSKEGNIKGFILYANGDYLTFIAKWTTEKKFHIDVVQNFKPESLVRKVDYLVESPAKITRTIYNPAGIKTGEFKFNKIK